MCLAYLKERGGAPHALVVPLHQLGPEPALQEDDLVHDLLVQRVLQLLTLQLLQIDLRKDNNSHLRFTFLDSNCLDAYILYVYKNNHRL